MKLEVIGEHTIDTALLAGGWVLDAGCRDFVFAREMYRRGEWVHALDPDPTIELPKADFLSSSNHDNGVWFSNKALAIEAGDLQLVMTADPQARHIEGLYAGRPQGMRVAVQATTVTLLGELHNIRMWDAVKLDIEGAEYEILRTWPGAIAKQISVEFHEHCAPRPQALYDEIFKHLSQWYEVVQHEKSARHCLPPNWWDSLFVLREELR